MKCNFIYTWNLKQKQSSWIQRTNWWLPEVGLGRRLPSAQWVMPKDRGCNSTWTREYDWNGIETRVGGLLGCFLLTFTIALCILNVWDNHLPGTFLLVCGVSFYSDHCFSCVSKNLFLLVLEPHRWCSRLTPGGSREHMRSQGLNVGWLCKATLLPVFLPLGPDIPSPLSGSALQEPPAASPAVGLNSGFLFLGGHSRPSPRHSNILQGPASSARSV